MILIVQQILPKYRHDILRHLSQKDFTVFYSDDTKDQSLESTQTSEGLFQKVAIRKFRGFYTQSFARQIRHHRPKAVILLPEIKNIGFWTAYILKFFYGYKLIAWTHGINNKDYYTGIGWQSRLRLMMMGISDRVLVYSSVRAEELKKHIRSKITVVPNTLDTDQLDQVYNRLQPIAIEQLKQQHGITTAKVMIYMGRLIAGKQVHLSIALLAEVLKQIPDTSIIIVGDGPKRAELEAYAASLNIQDKVHFKGKITNSQTIGELLYLSDLQVHLGYVGLAVVDSMCFRTPVITLQPSKEGPYHSPEFSYLRHRENAIVAETPDHAAREVIHLLQSPDRLASLQDHARSTFLKDCSMHNFLNALNSLNEQ